MFESIKTINISYDFGKYREKRNVINKIKVCGMRVWWQIVVHITNTLGRYYWISNNILLHAVYSKKYFSNKFK